MNLIVYFSFDGNTQMIAKAIAETIGAELLELQTSKKYPTKGFWKYFWCGKSVFFGEKPALTIAPIDLNQYDTIIIGTPIWAGSLTPPVNSFIHQYPFRGKRLALFASHSGGGADKCFQKIKEKLPGNEIIGEMDFMNPRKNPQESLKKAADWAGTLMKI